MFYTIYKTVNLINNKVYYGAHKTKNMYDSYFGSGSAISKALKKYGKENFKKEILFCALNEKYMFEIEGEIITPEIVNLSNTYNQKPGGKGGFSHIDSSGKNNCMKRPEVVQKVAQAVSQYIKDNPEKHRAACVLGGKSRKGKKDTEETKNKRVESRLKTIRNKELKYELISPDNIKYKYATLSECYLNHNLNINVLKRWINAGVIVKTKHATRISETAENTYGWTLNKLDKK